MDLSLSESQQMLKDGAEDFLARSAPRDVLVALDDTETGYSDAMWKAAAEIGWLGIVTPEAYGGTGGTLTDAAVVFEALGGGPVPGPFFSSGVLAPILLTGLGSDAQQERLLPKLATGETMAAFAMTEPDWGWGTDAVQMRAEPTSGGGYRLTGAKLFVFDALTADHLIVVARADSGVVTLLVDARAAGVTIRRMTGFLTGECVVEFAGVEVAADAVLPGDEAALAAALLRATPVLCAQMVGGAQQVYEMSVEYSRSRKQFGQPIGRFQHVQNHIVQLVNYLDGARWTTYEALWKLDAGREGTAVAAHLAKICASEGYLHATNYAHEVHAGIGVMREYGLTLYTRASRSLYHSLGDPQWHRRSLGSRMPEMAEAVAAAR